MHEPENLHEALKTLIDYNASVWTIIRDDNGKKREARIEDLQDVNLTCCMQCVICLAWAI